MSPDKTSRKQLRVAGQHLKQTHTSNTPSSLHVLCTQCPPYTICSLSPPTGHAQDAPSERDNRDTEFTRCWEGHNEAHTRVLVGVRGGGETCLLQVHIHTRVLGHRTPPRQSRRGGTRVRNGWPRGPQGWQRHEIPKRETRLKSRVRTCRAGEAFKHRAIYTT